MKAAAAALRDTANLGEFVCRVGGEEFGVVLPGQHGEAAVALVEGLRAAVAAVTLVCPDGETRSFTVSLGVAWISGPVSGPVDPDVAAGQLYRAADRALYEAKRQGRNRVCASTEPVSWQNSAPARAA